MTVARCLPVLAGAILLPTTVMAEQVEHYFRSPAYQCGNYSYVAEWSVTGDTSQGVTLHLFTKRTDRSSFEGSKWQLAKDALQQPNLTLNGQNGRPAYKLSSLLSEQRKVEVFDRRGNIRPDCTPILTRTSTPTERYEAVLELLTTEAPTPEDTLRVPQEISGLPPNAMLPTLLQSEMQKTIKNEREAFWKRYRKTSMNRAMDPEDTKLLLGLETVWIAQTSRGNREWHGKLLHSAQDARAKALLEAEVNPDEMRIVDGERLCRRVDGFGQALGWTWDWRDYLEITTGLPLEFWSLQTAEEFLANVSGCTEAKTFSDVVAERWPSIEARIAGFARLLDERDKIATMEINLASLAESNWLSVDSQLVDELYYAGISRDDALEVLEPVLKRQRDAAVEIMSSELYSEAKARNLSFQEHLTFCSNWTGKIGYVSNFKLSSSIFERCEEQLAHLLEASATQRIHEVRDNLLARAGTVQDLIETDGYDVRGAVPDLYGAGRAFQTALATIQNEMNMAEAATEAIYQTVLTSTLEGMRKAFEAAEPFTESEDQATAQCNRFTERGFSYTGINRLEPIIELCRVSVRKMQAKRMRVECGRVWDNIETPSKDRSGQLRSIREEFFSEATVRDVATCVRFGADLDMRDDAGRTPLHYAASFSWNPDMITGLVELGARANARDENGLVPLHLAARNNQNTDVTVRLLELGAYPNARDGNGRAPLHLAAESTEVSGVITRLVKLGAHMNARDEEGWTPLHYAAAFNDNPDVITVLADLGADGTKRTTDGSTAWDLAQNNEVLRGTDAWWRLNDLRFD